MPKKQTEITTPQVTKLPLPISDTPLVIDLPDGQKIVIGKMQSGSVIEVATWRGTGRPDSRTNRLMMGMNSGAPAVQEVPTNQAQVPAQKSFSSITNAVKVKIVGITNVLLELIKFIAGKISSLTKNKKLPVEKIAAQEPEETLPLPSASEVDEWLEAVLKKSQKKSARDAAKNLNSPAVGGSKTTKKSVVTRKSSSTKKKSASSKSKKKS